MRTEVLPGSPTHGLRSLHNNPHLLIPERLLELVGDPERVRAIPLPIWLGRLDQEYQPDLSTIIVGSEVSNQPNTTPRDSTSWIKMFNSRHQLAIDRGLIEPQDQILISLIADTFHTDSRIIMVESYAEAAYVRGKGLVQAFFDNFANHLRVRGYEIMCAVSERSLPFWLRTGWQIFNHGDYDDSSLASLAAVFKHQSTRGTPIFKFL